MPVPNKNSGPLLVDKVRGYFDRLPPWLRDRITIRIEHQKVDSKINDLDPIAIDSELKQEVTDEKLRTNKFLGDGEPGSGNDLSDLPISQPSEVVLPETGQVATVTETISETEGHLVEGPPLRAGNAEQIGGVWVKKEVEAPTFDDKVYQIQREDLIPPEFRALVPEKLEAHTIDGVAEMPVLGEGELSRKEEQQKVGIKKVTVQSRDMTEPPVITGQKIDPEWHGVTTQLTQSIVPAGTGITQSWGITDGSVKPIDGVNALKETWNALTGFPTVYLHNYDAEINSEIETHVDILPNNSAQPAAAGLLDFEDRKIDGQHISRIQHFPTTLPTEMTYETRMFTFPAILVNLVFQLVALATPSRSEVQFTAGVRAQFTIPTRVTTYTYYSWGAPTPGSVITWAPGDIIFKGASYQISLSNILYNTWSNIGVTYTADAVYGNIVDRFSVNATNPSASTYVSWIGTQQCISSTVSRYKRLWVKKDSYVTIV